MRQQLRPKLIALSWRRFQAGVAPMPSAGNQPRKFRFKNKLISMDAAVIDR